MTSLTSVTSVSSVSSVSSVTSVTSVTSETSETMAYPAGHRLLPLKYEMDEEDPPEELYPEFGEGGAEEVEILEVGRGEGKGKKRLRVQEKVEQGVTLQKKALLKKAKKVKVKQQVGDTEVDPLALTYVCHHCPDSKPFGHTVLQEYLRHLASGTHHHEELVAVLPPSSKVHPYPCPKCGKQNRDLSTLTRHFGVKCREYHV